MASRKRAEHEAEPSLSDAAERARALIQGLQSRLKADAGGAVQEQPEETQEDLERQLLAYFETAAAKGETGSSRASILSEIRNRVVDGVVERILREWEQPQQGTATALESDVVARLIERVLERLGKG